MGNSPSKNEPLPSSSSTITPAAAADDDDVPLSRRKPLNINSSTEKQSKKREVDLDLEIAASMARLLVPLPTAARPCVPSDYGSSFDSETSLSPLFSSEKDEDSVFLLGSVSTSPKHRDLEEAVGSLDPIFETLESTPEPDQLFGVPFDNKLNNVVSQVSVSSSETSAPASAPASYTKRAAVPPPGCDIDGIIDRLVQVGLRKHKKTSQKNRDKLPLTNDDIKYILTKSRSIFMSQPALLRLSPPVKVVGDIHGQLSDLIRIFNSCGYPPYTNYLFLGDYVDRGYRSLETILLLLCYKIKYPENFFMLRGNHESANITKVYGFYDECKRRLPAITGNHKMWKSFIDVFNTLPIAATINDKIFCIHGGLSPELQHLSQIENIKRPTDVPDKGLLADLLWSDPDPSVKTFSLNHWPKNDRGVSFCFGKKHVDYFCSLFNFDLIVRGHMVVEDGYEFFNKRKLVTVFLAPNYCGEFNNCGALMSVDKTLCCSFEIIKPN